MGVQGVEYKEEYDLYDIILDHLLGEGYAETVESAEAIMVNMSEEWKDEILSVVMSEG
jgi:NAD(P)H-hydrate repair Nnr-like enzyme with NAD(P)H-hydrate epimerase domain